MYSCTRAASACMYVAGFANGEFVNAPRDPTIPTFVPVRVRKLLPLAYYLARRKGWILHLRINLR